jgi:predicted secreted hydrolase
MTRERGKAAFFVAALLLAPSVSSVQFPRDHGSHSDAALEWWYWTGHLSSTGGREYGFQLTFFRLRDLHLAHFAWSDLSAGKFTFDEKTHLELPGIAGASKERLDVFNEDWSAKEEGGAQNLFVRTNAGELSLQLSEAKPPVLHGAGGISRKGPGASEYSHYVSITRLGASGALSRGGKSEKLTGTAGSITVGAGRLPAGAAGWDWFALQLTDGSELMPTGCGSRAASPFSSGTHVPASGPRCRSPERRASFPST